MSQVDPRSQRRRSRPWGWALALGWGVLAAGGGPSLAGPSPPCVFDGEGELVAITLSFPPPRYQHTLGAAEIKRISPEANARNTLVFGETLLRTFHESRYQFLIRELNDGAVCSMVKKVELTLGYQEPVVHIAREYPQGGCEYLAILDHEHRHINALRDVAVRFEGKIRREVEQEIRRIGAVRNPPGGPREYLKTKMDAVIDRLMRQYKEAVNQANARVDAPASREKDFAQCRNWGVKMKVN
ncbi:MAG: hypothetical protein HQL51_01145 [Magnetococcales bacterium]|nr:hypothetical protein [Magnetococcales bacterium]